MSQVAARAPGSNPDSPEAIGQKLREALPAMRVHSLSLHDGDGDVVWLSEGALGPDEHGVVLEAMGTHTLEPSAPLSNRPLGDGRNALVIPARTASGSVVGAAMVIVDTKQISSTLLLRLGTPGVRDALARLAARLQPASVATPPAATPPAAAPPAMTPSAAVSSRAAPAAAPRPALAVAPLPDFAPLTEAPKAVVSLPPPSHSGDTLELSLVPEEPPPPNLPDHIPTLAPAKPMPTVKAAPPRIALPKSAATATVAPVRAATPATAQEEPAPPKAAAVPPSSKGADTPAAVATPAGLPALADEPDSDATIIAPKPELRDLALVVQQLLKLRSGGRTRRYEVLLRSRSDPSRDAVPATLAQALTATDANSAIDRHVLTKLVMWLGNHPQVWESEPSSFTVNLSLGTLRDRGFLRFASALFDEWKVTPGVVGFEIPERACLDAETDVRAFVESCEKLGSFIVLDDFTMHSSAVPFLASPAVRVVKIEARLTMAAMKDKLSQAMVIAISQASKVLGVHCVAKRIESSMARQWLSAIGIDFAQGFALERPQTLDTLLCGSKSTQKSSDPAAS